MGSAHAAAISQQYQSKGFVMNLRQKVLLAVMAIAPTASFAAVDAAVTGAMTAAGADGLTYVGALAVAAAAFVLIKKVLTKLGISF